jgi:hypothetical protein
MYKWQCLFVTLVSALFACQSSNNPPVNLAADTSHYYPVAAYLTDQISENDLKNLPRTIQHTINNKKLVHPLGRDSFLFFTQQFVDVSKQFSETKYRYQETFMHDLSTQSYTLSYRPVKPGTGDLDYMDVLLDENTKMVKRIDIRRSGFSKNLPINEHFSWRTDKGFLITREIGYLDSMSHFMEIINVSWEPENRQPL